MVLLLATFPRVSETFIVQHFLSLLQAGWDVHIFCAQFSQTDWEQYRALRERPELRRRVHASLPTNNKWLAGLLWAPAFVYLLLIRPVATWTYFRNGWDQQHWRICKHFYLDAPLIILRPQLIHIEFGALAAGREHLGKCLGCKLVISFRGYDLHFSGLEDPKFYTQVWEAADGIHLLGRDLWHTALRRGCPQEMLHALIPPAVNLDEFRPAHETQAGWAEDANRPLRILSVGRLEWKKGYEFALKAVLLASQTGLSLEYRIAGGGEYLEALAFARHQLSLDQIAHFTGPLDREGVTEQYQWADLLLHPSLSEGFCNVVLEAQAMGLACIVTDAGGLPENIVDGETGFVVPRRASEQMADKILYLAKHPLEMAAMGQAGRARVADHFRMDQQAALFEDFYRKVIGIDESN